MGWVLTDFKIEKNINTDIFKNFIKAMDRLIPMGFLKRENSLQLGTNKIFDEAIAHCIPALATSQKPDWLKFAEKHSDVVKDRLISSTKYLGTLGGGNHFIELQTDEHNHLCIMLHSGSRGPGEAIARVFMNEAKLQNSKWHSRARQGTEFLPEQSEEGKFYLEAVVWAQNFAFHNRAVMLETIKKIIKQLIPDIKFENEVNIHHNYVARENHYGKNLWVHRKGATKVRKEIFGIIPGSMGTNSYIVRGTNNNESLHSCSHGAGRTMSRKKAKETLNINNFKQQMMDIISFSVNETHLDEAPEAYKNIEIVMKNQEDLVEIVHSLKPITNIKA